MPRHMTDVERKKLKEFGEQLLKSFKNLKNKINGKNKTNNKSI